MDKDVSLLINISSSKTTSSILLLRFSLSNFNEEALVGGGSGHFSRDWLSIQSQTLLWLPKKLHCLVKVSIHRHQQKSSLYARMLIYNHLCCSDDTHWLICTCDHCLWSRLGRIFRASWLHLHLDFMPSDIPGDYRKSGNASVKGVLKKNEKQRSS